MSLPPSNGDAGALLDAAFPHCGPCGICGRGWARHRTTDAMRDRAQSGESVESIARDYRKPVEAVRVLVGMNGAAYGRWLRSEAAAPARSEGAGA